MVGSFLARELDPVPSSGGSGNHRDVAQELPAGDRPERGVTRRSTRLERQAGGAVAGRSRRIAWTPRTNQPAAKQMMPG